MHMWKILLVFEIVPVILWALGWYYENSFSQYPDIKKGFKTKESGDNKEIWVYGNKVAGKVFSALGTILFFIVALGFISININPVVMAFILFITICVAYMIIQGLIKKKFKAMKK